MADIRYMKLDNHGLFVARIIVHYTNTDRDGKTTKHTFKLEKDINARNSYTLDLSNLRIADGCPVQLEAYIILGSGKKAKQTHTYRASSDLVAPYLIRGTTLINDLSEGPIRPI